ncbi:hypothetical protein ALTERO38_52103 [Alteromonas sp. 38]|nr:hypothetical protein ALTERO38_52103 [Alteromonas sp. 38]
MRMSKLDAAAVILRNSATFKITMRSSSNIDYLFSIENVSNIVLFNLKQSRRIIFSLHMNMHIRSVFYLSRRGFLDESNWIHYIFTYNR